MDGVSGTQIPQIVAQESRRRAARFEIALNARGKGREEGQSTARSSEARRLWARAATMSILPLFGSRVLFQPQSPEWTCKAD